MEGVGGLATAKLERQTVVQWLALLTAAVLLVRPTCGQYSVHRSDPFALLSATLKTNQQAACDGSELTLECPSGTKISIQLVEYGRRAPSQQVCPPSPVYPKEYLGTEGLDCSFPEALAHIEEKCHGQELCSMTVAPEAFGGGRMSAANTYFQDPCQGYRKYVEVAYQCRPTKFKSKLACHSDTLDLACEGEDAGKRLAVYSSSFANAAGSHVYCPAAAAEDYFYQSSSRQSKYEMEECVKASATQAVMDICHGRKRCEIVAEGPSLGAPSCNERQNIYLKTVYACVSKDVLKRKYQDEGRRQSGSADPSAAPPQPPLVTTEVEVGREGEEEEESVYATSSHTNYAPEIEMQGDLSSEDGDLTPKQERTASQDAAQMRPPDADGGGSGETSTEGGDMVVGFVSDFMSSYNHIKQHKEKFILFASLSVALGLALFLAMVVWGMYRSSRLHRIKNQVPQPPSTINAYYSSPPGSPTGPPPPGGTVDIELEVGDHEVDSAFRDPAPDPLVVASSSSPTRDSDGSPTMLLPYYGNGNGTLRRSATTASASSAVPNRRDSACGSLVGFVPLPHTCDTYAGVDGVGVPTAAVATVECPPPPLLQQQQQQQQQPQQLSLPPFPHSTSSPSPASPISPLTLSPSNMTPSSPSSPPAVNWVGSTAPPSGGILRNSINRDSPAGSVNGSDHYGSSLGGRISTDSNGKVVRYSTIGRPRVSSPGSRTPFLSEDFDLADPKSLTLSRVSNADHLLYG